MFEGFVHQRVETGAATINCMIGGRGAPLLLLHGYPQCLAEWARTAPLLAKHFTVICVDLRGYGASDKPPRGYDLVTLTADIAGLVRALGERDAVLVGHDWGGALAWSVASLRPDVVRRLAVLSNPHPRLFRRAALTELLGQSAASSHMMMFQLPWYPERLLKRDHASYIGHLLSRWGGPGYPDEETERRNRDAFLIPGVAHSALEYYRWAVRSLPRPDGVRYARSLRRRIPAPTLQIHGALDRCVLPRSAQGSGSYVRGRYDWHLLDGVGHYPHEEAPEQVTALLRGWLES